MTDFMVEPALLMSASEQWREQSAQVTTAGTRVAGASTAGFSEAVSSAARSFTTAWGTTIGTLATSADEISDHLDAGYSAYLMADVRAQQAFETWLGTKAP